jgi:hypothetical protein
MTVKSVKERARESQRAEFAQAGDRVPAGLEDLTIGIYDQIDVLDAERRSLLVRDILSRLGGLAKEADDPSERAIFGTMLGIANYTNEVGREIGCMTSTGDVAVDSILADIQEMLTQQFRAMLGGAADIVEAAADRVKERVEAGEDFEEVAREEERAMREAIAERAGEQVPVPVAKTDSDASTGLYL